MNNLVILSVSATVLFASCDQLATQRKGTAPADAKEEAIHNIEQYDQEVVVIDGCQYIMLKGEDGANRGYGYMAHKGNCNNPTHFYGSRNLISDTSRQPE